MSEEKYNGIIVERFVRGCVCVKKKISFFDDYGSYISHLGKTTPVSVASNWEDVLVPESKLIEIAENKRDAWEKIKNE